MKKRSGKITGIFVITAFLLSFMAVSCNKDPDSVSLQSFLDSTKDTNVDLSSEDFTLEDSSAITLSTASTITGGNSQYDLKNAVITVKADGTKIDNIKNAAEIIIDEAVGDGDFTISNSDIVKLTVKGGGANSIHIVDSDIDEIEVVKNDVRIVMEGTAKAAAVDVQSECILDSTSDSAEIESVTIADSVKNVTLEGKSNIKEISASSTDVKVTVASNDIKVETTVVETADGTVSTIKMEAESDDIKIPETKLPEGKKATEETTEQTSEETETTVEKKTYTVTYVTEYSSADSIKVEENTALSAAQLPSLTKDGYALEGWYIGETKIEAGYKVTQDITLTAKWTEKSTYTVRYSTSYGSVASIEVAKDTGLTAEQLPALTAEYYTFEGWYIGETKIEAGYKVTKDLVLTAKWKENTAIKGITVTVVSEDDSHTEESDVLNVTYAPQEGNNNYIILTAPAGYYEYQWTFMGVTTTQKRTYSGATPEKYTISLYSYSDGTYVAYLYIPVDGSTTGKSATIYFTVSRE